MAHPVNIRESKTAPSESPAQAFTKRVNSVDIVRGAIMVFMALDHVRDWTTILRIRPEDLTQSSPALFATRWITHFCAPTFFLLAGVGIGMMQNKGKRPAELSRFLVTRGLWLLVLELVITPVGFQFGFKLIPAFALVLWALGWSMILMAALVHLPRKILLPAALIVIFGHNLLDGITPQSWGSFAWLWHFLHVPGFMIPNVLFLAYPLVPWVAVMAAGSVLASIYQWDATSRRKLLIQCGVVATVLFVVLRAINGYGDPFPWSAQRTSALTVASFLNVQKYPPSLDFLLMTLGPVLIALAFTEQARGRIARVLTVYGRVPLFFYVTHLFVAHAVAVVLALIQGGELRRISVVADPGSIPAWYGLSLPGVYLMWLIVVALLYYPCRQWGYLKATRNDWWLKYL